MSKTDETSKKIEGLEAELKAVKSQLSRMITSELIEKKNNLEKEIAKLKKPKVEERASDNSDMIDTLIKKVDNQQETIEKQTGEIEALNSKIKEFEQIKE